MIEIRFRPLSNWPAGELRRRTERRASPFGAPHSSTLGELDRELRALEARDVVLELALREHHIRNDGGLRANAPAPEHPGVVLSFASAHGPLRYATDRFTTWHANLRAIVLGLESLRRVDRYGITRRGEQYAGWRQLPATGETGKGARGLLLEVTGLAGDVDDAQLARTARKVAHPDAGGDHETWLAVQRAIGTLEAGQ